MTNIALFYENYGPYHLARFENIQKAIRKTKIKVYAIELFERSSIYIWEQNKIETENFKKLKFKAGKKRKYISLLEMYKLWKLLTSLDINIAFVNGWGTSVAILINVMCWLKKIKVVVVSDSQEEESSVGIKELVKKIVVNKSSAAFVGGSKHRDYLQKLGKDFHLIIPGCDVIDNNHFTLSQRRDWTQKKILTVARLVPEKNLLSAASAFLEFIDKKQSTYNWTWEIVGYGELERDLQEIEKHSSGRIKLLGQISYQEMPRIYQSATLYWQPSIKEPWGLAVNEAMASGLPILISKECGCQVDLVDNSNGWIFVGNNRTEMVNALHNATSEFNHWERKGINSKRKIKEWDLNRFTTSFLHLVNII
jgi:1,2-diacylglycerol 3-alpha-glucosyltransferase